MSVILKVVRRHLFVCLVHYTASPLLILYNVVCCLICAYSDFDWSGRVACRTQRMWLKLQLVEVDKHSSSCISHCLCGTTYFTKVFIVTVNMMPEMSHNSFCVGMDTSVGLPLPCQYQQMSK